MDQAIVYCKTVGMLHIPIPYTQRNNWQHSYTIYYDSAPRPQISCFAHPNLGTKSWCFYMMYRLFLYNVVANYYAPVCMDQIRIQVWVKFWMVESMDMPLLCRCGLAKCKIWHLHFSRQGAPWVGELWSGILDSRHHRYRNVSVDYERLGDNTL